MRHRYTLLFAALTLGHTVVALASYRAISARASARSDTTAHWAAGELATRAMAIGVRREAVADSYARIAAADEAWRQKHARQYTLQELRVRGDGRRTPRQAMQDRVFRFTRVGDRARAIQELRQWVRANGRDSDAMLWLARLLNEEGKATEAVPLYRRALAIENAH